MIAAVSLLLGVEEAAGALAAAGLLGAFTAAIGINLVRGRTFECGCAGASPSHISWGHVVLVVFLQIGIVRRLDAVESRPAAHASHSSASWQGPDIGDPLPAFAAPTPDGSMVSTEAFGGQPRVLVFVSAGCGPCHALMEELAGARDLSGAVTVVTQREDLQALGVPKGVTVLLQDGREMEDLLGLVSSPFGMTLTQAGIVADKRVPNTTDHLRELLSTARQVHPLAKH